MAGISEIFSRFFTKEEPAPVSIVAARFLQVFNDHGVQTGQIPRLFPEIRLSDLHSTEALLKILTPALLDKVAHFFGVQTKWLEGADDSIYDHVACYKQPEILLEDLKNVEMDALSFPLRVLVSDRNLDYLDGRRQSLVTIVVEPIAVLEDEHINRYRVYSDGWNWSHHPCRIELKAIARLLYKELGMPVPLIKVTPEDLEKVGRLEMIPHRLCNSGLITSPSLEDFAIFGNEGIAHEEDELPEVLEYIRDNRLEGILHGQRNQATTTAGTSERSEQARKAALKKNQPIKEIKEEFIKYCLNGNIKSITQAASKFYEQLPEEKKRLLSPTNAANTLKRAMTDYRKAQNSPHK